MDAAATAEDVRRVVGAVREPGPAGPSDPRRAADGDRDHRQPRHRGLRRVREPARGQRGHPGLGPLQARLARGQAREHGRLGRGRSRSEARGSRSSRARAPSSRRSRRSRSAGACARPARRSTAAARTSRARRRTRSRGSARRASKILSRVRAETGLPIITEVLDTETVERVAESRRLPPGRRAQHAELLPAQAARPHRKPVLLKRGMSATIEELLLSAEYLLAEGNYEVILCERGVRTFADHTRNTLDLSAVPYVQRISHLPILVDPSHGTGQAGEGPAALARRRRRRRGRPARSRSTTAGARALGRAAGDPAARCSRELVGEIRRLAPVVGRTA